VQPKKEGKEGDFKELHNILKRYRVKMPAKEMVEQNSCCIKFLEELMKTRYGPSEKEFIAISKDCRAVIKVPILAKSNDPGCLTLSVMLEGHYIREGLCDSGAYANLISLASVEELENLNMHFYYGKVGYANGQEERASRIIYDLPINI